MNPQILRSKGAFGFQHPVRLYLPMSKREEFLRDSGENVLASFPMQATIHFYDDESDTESELESELELEPAEPKPNEEERAGETQPPAPQCQEQKAAGTVNDVDMEELDC
ncbi:protein ripply3 isoform X2 [Cavia porcellus]|nr:protein ripply3 isoform X2 [Cavia porcellus]XP_023418266.1 protein ripply3 isoform X2 [Cavia porcellus]